MVSLTLPDVNILVYAFNVSSPHHQASSDWLAKTVNGPETFGLANIVLSGFIRIATHPRILSSPAPTEKAVTFCENLQQLPNCVSINPGPTHFEIFANLCRTLSANGNDTTDAYLAALAIEHNCEFITVDKGFKRFPGLRWRHPLD